MNAPESSSRDPLEQVAEAFLERFRRGERPSIGEYTRAHPELAEEIRDLFPALVEMEELKSGDLSGLPKARRSTCRSRSISAPRYLESAHTPGTSRSIQTWSPKHHSRQFRRRSTS